MGADLHHAGHLWRSLLCLLPPLLLHQLWRSLLAVDGHPVHLRSAGRQLRVSEQVGQHSGCQDFPMVSHHQRTDRPPAVRWSRRNLLRRQQLHRHQELHALSPPFRGVGGGYLPLGQRLAWSRRPAQSLGFGVRTGSDVPGACVGYFIYN